MKLIINLVFKYICLVHEIKNPHSMTFFCNWSKQNFLFYNFNMYFLSVFRNYGDTTPSKFCCFLFGF